jgi:integrase
MYEKYSNASQNCNEARRPVSGYSRESYALTHTENKGSKGQAATGANTCKWDSTAPAYTECQAPATGIPHCQGSRTARKRGRYGHRDATMILIAFRHGLRPSELVTLRWDQVDLSRGLLHVRRAKKGMPSVQPLGGTELRALRKLRREEKKAVSRS